MLKKKEVTIGGFVSAFFADHLAAYILKNLREEIANSSNNDKYLYDRKCNKSIVMKKLR